MREITPLRSSDYSSNKPHAQHPPRRPTPLNPGTLGFRAPYSLKGPCRNTLHTYAHEGRFADPNFQAFIIPQVDKAVPMYYLDSYGCLQKLPPRQWLQENLQLQKKAKFWISLFHSHLLKSPCGSYCHFIQVYGPNADRSGIHTAGQSSTSIDEVLRHLTRI